MFKFKYSKYNPRGLFSGGGAYTWKEFSFQKLVLERPGAYKRRGLLSEFYGIQLVKILPCEDGVFLASVICQCSLLVAELLVPKR